MSCMFSKIVDVLDWILILLKIELAQNVSVEEQILSELLDCGMRLVKESRTLKL